MAGSTSPYANRPSPIAHALPSAIRAFPAVAHALPSAIRAFLTVALALRSAIRAFPTIAHALPSAVRAFLTIALGQVVERSAVRNEARVVVSPTLESDSA
ncbi:MAG TPA: hypothetical protein VL738_34835 [Dactylosporangium sp.]|nr:hypothetical protein [Dactylosporangium sp.]